MKTASRKVPILFCTLFLTVILPVSSLAATRYVCPTGCPYTSIQAAICSSFIRYPSFLAGLAGSSLGRYQVVRVQPVRIV